eukprot:2398608-Alexandrium_andersonii.AAC.1
MSIRSRCQQAERPALSTRVFVDGASAGANGQDARQQLQSSVPCWGEFDQLTGQCINGPKT